MAYLLDSNVFIDAKNHYYGFDTCPGFWDWIVREHGKGTVKSIDKVEDELIGLDDELSEWARQRGPEFFLRPDAGVLPSLQQVSTWVTNQNFEPGAVSTFMTSADYYLVAVAHAYGHTVVTREVSAPFGKKVKIPDACLALGVQFMQPFAMLHRERARFVLEA